MNKTTRNFRAKCTTGGGFTLAELLIVVAVIAVLVAVAIPTFTGQLEKSRQSVDVSNMRAAYAQAKLLVINQDDENSPFHDALAKVKTGKPLTEADKTFYFWYNKDTNVLEDETDLSAIFNADDASDPGQLVSTKDADNYRVGKALTATLVANTEDFAEGKITYTDKGSESAPATLPTVNKGIVVTISYDDDPTSANYQTFVLKDITFSNKKATTIPAITAIELSVDTLPAALVHNKSIDTSLLTVTATYADGTTAVIDDYKFGYSEVNTKSKASQLIAKDILNTAVIPVAAPVGSFIYVVKNDFAEPLDENGLLTVTAGISAIANASDATLTYTTAPGGFKAVDSTTEGEAGVFKVTMTAGDPVILTTSDMVTNGAITGVAKDKFAFAVSYMESNPDLDDLTIVAPTTNATDTTTASPLKAGHTVYLYYKYSDSDYIIKALQKVTGT